MFYTEQRQKHIHQCCCDRPQNLTPPTSNLRAVPQRTWNESPEFGKGQRLMWEKLMEVWLFVSLSWPDDSSFSCGVNAYCQCFYYCLIFFKNVSSTYAQQDWGDDVNPHGWAVTAAVREERNLNYGNLTCLTCFYFSVKGDRCCLKLIQSVSVL